jgi:hypothetical protein
MNKVSTNSGGRGDYYVYQPIDSSDELSIRLLKLEPGDGAERIEISLINSTLKDPPEFDALSYVWGGEGKPNAIYIEGKKLPVTASLHGALLRFRNATTSRTLWIDAICIDQSNIPERNRQVRIMRTIYQSAIQVLVWLGDGEETDGLALKMIEKFTKESWKFSQRPEEPRSFDKLVRPLAFEDAPEWPALDKLLQRSWFGRIWTLQEIYVPKKPVVVFGPHTISWDALADLTVYIRKNHLSAYLVNGSTEFIAGYSSVPFIHDYRQVIKSTQRPGLVLLDLLLKAMPSHTTDPRDRVFALMGIAELNHIRNIGADPTSPYSSITTDYSLGCNKVYMMVAQYILLEAKELCFLATARAKKAGSTMSLPSWVPDWNYLNMEYVQASLAFATYFKCDGDFELDVSVSEDDRTLTVVGCLLDKIKVVGKGHKVSLGLRGSPGSAETQQREFRHRLDVLRECDTIIGRDNAEAGARLPVDYWRFLVCDLTYDHQPAPREFAEAYELYRYGVKNYSVYYNGRDAKVLQAVTDIINNALYQRNPLLHNRWSHGRVLYRTNQGVFGWAPREVEVGDWVVMLGGAGVPFVLRPSINERYVRWNLIGELYAYSFMNIGGAMSVDVFKGLEWQRISIV